MLHLSKISSVCCLLALLVLSGCQNETPAAESSTPAPAKKNPAPVFNADHAYQMVKTQVEFGPRVPGTESQKKCAAWIETEARKYADTVYTQRTNVVQVKSLKTYPAINIIAK